MLTPEPNGVTKPRCRKNYNGALYIRQESFGKPPNGFTPFCLKLSVHFFVIISIRQTTGHAIPKNNRVSSVFMADSILSLKENGLFCTTGSDFHSPVAETKWE